MKKHVLLLAAFLFTVSSAVFAQTITVKTFGVSPRDVAADTVEHYFDSAYNGMQNVGIQIKVYLKGSSTAALQNPAWGFVSKPENSNAEFGVTKDIDTSNQIVTFIPDVSGEYVVSFADGGLQGTIIVDAATYVGLGTDYSPVPNPDQPSCKNCHGPFPSDNPYIFNKWVGTAHSRATKDGVDGILSSHFRESCLLCHTTGYTPGADNGGFDDFPFVFPSVLEPGAYDTLVVHYPQAMNLANVQCESCHGPGSKHVINPLGTKDQMVSLSADNCNLCHNYGTYYVIGEQWKFSGDDGFDITQFGFDGGHAKGAFVISAGTRSGCSPCHSGAGYVEWIKEGRPVDSEGLPAATDVLPEATVITCAVCHDPHDATNLHQLRALTTQLADSTQITSAKYGTGAQCMDCHRARRYAKTYSENVNNQSSHYGAHHGPQADMLLGKNAPDFGIPLPTSPHGDQGNSCNDCHMVGPAVVNGEVNLVGGHTWNMTNAEGVDNVAACVNCHGSTVGSSFADKKYYINGNADLDGNGVAEGFQIEVEGLMAQLSRYLPHDANGSVSITKSNAENMTLTPEIMKAGYVYIWVEEDRSLGLHNPAFTFALLKASIESMGGYVNVEYPKENMPTDFALSQNYPNPFNPTTTINFTLPTQSKVKIIVYDVTGAMVKVLVDGDYAAGSHETQFNTNSVSNLASGIYFYQINAVSNDNGANFIQTKKMVLLK